MISIDQVLLLQQKVESAVQKIVELKAENDALRNKCSELTNALSEKSELLASFTADEKKIEDSILGALDRLNKIENSVLSQAGQNTALKSEADGAHHPRHEPGRALRRGAARGKRGRHAPAHDRLLRPGEDHGAGHAGGGDPGHGVRRVRPQPAEPGH